MIRKIPRRLKKILIITALVIAAFLLLLIAIVSPVAKYMIEKYDEKYLGRQIDIGWLYINPLTGYAHIHNLKVFEQKSDNIFFSADGVTVNLSMLKLFSKVYEISRFSLDAPRARIIQDGDWFNFSDIVKKFTSGEPKKTSTEPVKLSIKNVKIRDGEFHYLEKQSPINYFIKKVNFQSKGKTWDVDTVSASYSFLSGPGSGGIRGNITFNLKTKDYKAATFVEKFDLKIVEQYVKAMANYGELKATLDAHLNSAGNLNDSMSMSSKGRIAISDLHFGKSENEDYFSFDKLIIKIEEMNLKKGVRIFDTIMLVHPVMKYERYDKLDNIQRMFGAKGANIDSAKSNPEKFNLVLKLADYIKMLSETFKEDYFRINKFAIQEADIQYNDFSISEKFSMALNPFSITADSIDKNKDKIIIKAKSLIQPHGEISAQLSVNPKNTGYFDLNYKFGNIPATMFNPYLVTFTSFPLDRGNIELYGTWNVDNSIVNSENHFIVVDPRVTKKVRKKDTKWLPLPLIMSLVRERGNVIDYKIPIKGNLKDPKFKIGDVVTDLLRNIFVKPPSSPYIFDVRDVENEVEKSMSIKWKLRTAQLLPNQEKFIERMAKFLKETPEASLTIHPMLYAEKEKEHILLYEAKKKYYMAKNNINKDGLEEKDSLKIEKMSVKDSAFVKYLDAYVKDNSLFTIQQKCSVYLGERLVAEKYRSLIRQREKAFLKYFEENKTDSQVIIVAASNVIPFNGFSFYKISYKGDIPNDLEKAYQKLENYDDENPRKRYKKWRE
jgi:hypothetical protein